jgi:MFS family permease
MDFYRHLFTRSPEGRPVTFTLIYIVSIIFTFQTLLTAYSSSTYIEQFIAPKLVGLLFAVGAAGAIIFSLILPKILQALGNVKTILLLVLLINLALVFIGTALTPTLTIVAFVLYLVINPQVYLNIDIFLETLIGDEEGGTGTKRGFILAIMSVAAFFSPLVMGLIIGDNNNLAGIYYVGAGIGLVLFSIIVARFRHFYDPIYRIVKIKDMIRDSVSNLDLRTVMSTQFLLQFFYAWAVIYIPLFLATEVGLDWTSISYILAAGLFAFVLFEYPIGVMADRHWGEKEMMALGFVILAIASASITYMGAVGLIGWMCLMFFSRIGASLVEVTTESYFFKQVKGDQPNVISLFRLMRPLANLAGALVGSITLYYLDKHGAPFSFMFFVLALVMASGVFITSFLTDTK